MDQRHDSIALHFRWRLCSTLNRLRPRILRGKTMGKVNALFQDAQEAREEAQMVYAIADVPHEDYDNYDMLNKLFHALAPHGWQNSTWKNDTCPSLQKEERHGNVCRIFVDYLNPDMREDPSWALLAYTVEDREGYLVLQEGFDNVDKLIIFLTKTIN